MCVDDDINMLNSSEDILISAGFDVSLAKSGTQELKLLQKGVKCDLILLDVDMPEKKATVITPELLIIMLVVP